MNLLNITRNHNQCIISRLNARLNARLNGFNNRINRLQRSTLCVTRVNNNINTNMTNTINMTSITNITSNNRYFSTDAVHDAVHKSQDININFILQNGEKITCIGKEDDTLLDICLNNELDVEGACGGECCCSTCHVYLTQEMYNSLEEPDEDELDMLDLAIGVTDTSRLGCQLKINSKWNNATVTLPAEVSNQMPE